jgi:energy-coupling factor transporter ATP-binding protein EcfA2
MKISLLKFKNCLGIKELEVRPGKVMLIEGREGQGKTSILETLQRTFTNKSDRPQFVYSGENKAESYLLLDDGTEIKKVFNKDGKPTTTDVQLNGMRPAGSETFLKSLISDKQLNPISLIEMDDKQLNEFILSIIPIKITQDDILEWIGHQMPVDTSRHGLQVCKELEKCLYDTRAEVNRSIKTLEGEVSALKDKLPQDYDPETWRNVQISQLYEKVRAATEINNNRIKAMIFIDGIGDRKRSLEEKRDIEVSAIEDKIKQLQEQINEIRKNCQKQLEEEDRKTEVTGKWMREHPAVDIAPIEKEMKEAEEMKQLVALADSLVDKKTELESKTNESRVLTDKLEYVRSRPGFLLKSCAMPVDDLQVDGGGNVLINDRPLKNLSGGERIRLVVKLARATSGPLKLILIDGFERLSPQAQKEFIDEVQGDDYQYIMTRVTDGVLRILNINEDGQAVDAESGELMEV